MHESHAHNKSLSSPSAKPQRSAKRSSKFNRILNNLERSILNQFGNQQHSATSNNNKSSRVTNKPAKGSHSTPQSSSSANGLTSINLPAAAVLQSQTNKRCNNNAVQQVQKDARPTTTTAAARERITFQEAAKADLQRQQQKPSNSKMILNKYQQQIVSTMRSNQLLVNNKLSIPPPHANDEARNQNHRLLFGAGDSSAQNNRQLHDTGDCNWVSSSSRSSANKKADTIGNKMCEVSQLRSNSSPASSAVSLPAIPLKPGSQYNHNNSNNKQSIKERDSSLTDADDESGFFTYQSQRSLSSAKTAATNQDASILTNANANELQNKTPQGSGSMILVPNTTQVPLGPVDYNMVSPQQQFLYNYHTQPIQHLNHNHPTHSQQSMNTQQQQLVASNQVPIISLGSRSHSYTSNDNNSSQQMNHVANNMRGSNQQYNDRHRLYSSSYCAPAPNVTVSPNTLLPYVGGPFDQSQQIYANAPPKPRRYQYYDSNQSMFPAAMMAGTSQNLSTMSNNPSVHLIKQPFSNQRIMANQHQQQQQINHPIYNSSYIQVPSLYQQRIVQQNNQQPANNQLQQHRQLLQINNPYVQHNQHAMMPSAITKSKSSLDARDLMRFKQSTGRQVVGGDSNRSNTLRLSHQQPHQQLIYGSRYEGLNGYPSASMHMSNQHPVALSSYSQSNHLQRSKSVSHLLADYNGYLANNPQQDLIIDRRQATAAPKFLSVSSASTNNLNYVGLMPVSAQQVSQPNQFVKVSSQLDISQPSQYNNNHNGEYSSPSFHNAISATISFV